jgi:hypothetical protein
MELSTICRELFGEKYSINPDGQNQIVINCTIPWDTLTQIKNPQVDLPETELVCGIKLCNIPGTVVVIYPIDNTYGYFLVNIKGIIDTKLQRGFRKLYIVWAQKHKENIKFNLENLLLQQRAREEQQAQYNENENPQNNEEETATEETGN